MYLLPWGCKLLDIARLECQKPWHIHHQQYIFAETSCKQLVSEVKMSDECRSKSLIEVCSTATKEHQKKKSISKLYFEVVFLVHFYHCIHRFIDPSTLKWPASQFKLWERTKRLVSMGVRGICQGVQSPYATAST